MSKILLSIIIPVYNEEEYLPECLQSIPSDSGDRLEVILVDDGSADRSGELCDTYAKSYENAVVIHQENGGSVRARNRGTEAACGEYVLFCDSDDFYEEGAIEEIIRLLEKYAPDILIFNAYETENKEKKKLFSPCLFEEGFIKDKKSLYDIFFLSYYLNSMCMKVCRRELFENSIAENSFSGNLGDDFLESAPLFKKAQRIYYTQQPYYNYRIDSGMMRRSNRNYYSQYLTVNHAVGDILKNEEIIDMDAKLAVHLMNAAYGSVIQYRYDKKTDMQEIGKVSEDCDFRTAYKLMIGSGYEKYLSRKQRLVISCLYNRHFLMLEVLIAVRRLLDRL